MALILISSVLCFGSDSAALCFHEELVFFNTCLFVSFLHSGATEVGELGLWGNYSIPKDNPYNEDKELQKEIWALGLRNPWRCSFDSARPSYFLCADVGQVLYFLFFPYITRFQSKTGLQVTFSF